MDWFPEKMSEIDDGFVAGGTERSAQTRAPSAEHVINDALRLSLMHFPFKNLRNVTRETKDKGRRWSRLSRNHPKIDIHAKNGYGNRLQLLECKEMICTKVLKVNPNENILKLRFTS